MTRSTARTGKLKRAKARKGPDPRTRDATVGELLAALHDGTAATPPEAEAGQAEASPAEPSSVAEAGESSAALIQRADEAMYEEKLRTRDRFLPVSIVRDSTCVSCRMTLPAQLCIEVKRAE